MIVTVEQLRTALRLLEDDGVRAELAFLYDASHNVLILTLRTGEQIKIYASGLTSL